MTQLSSPRLRAGVIVTDSSISRLRWFMPGFTNEPVLGSFVILLCTRQPSREQVCYAAQALQTYVVATGIESSTILGLNELERVVSMRSMPVNVILSVSALEPSCLMKAALSMSSKELVGAEILPFEM
jgi:hypothetical protein